MINVPNSLVFAGFSDIYKWQKILKVKEKDCAAVIACIEAHPDWDDERVAEEIDWVD